MRSYVLKRIGQLLLVMFSASFLTFGLTYISPGDPAEMMLTSHDMVPTEALLEKTREEMGLNDPFLVQYRNWLKDLLKGDLGFSYSLREEVSTILPPRIGMTLRLALAALTILLVFSLLFGIVSAIRKSTIIDYVIRVFSFAGISIPTFWLGLLLIYAFVVKIRWFKITDPRAFESVILPAFTLAIPLIGRYTRQIRAAILEQVSQDYVIGARARGIKQSEIIVKHVLPNAMMGIITLLGLSTAMLLGGTVIVEHIFSWPGLGAMALEAITNRDYPLLQSYVIFMALIYVSINFLVDVSTQALDPRIRFIRGTNR